MVNTEIMRLINDSKIAQEDAIEVIRIFEIMTEDKKIEIINNWKTISMQIKAHREQIEQEKELLLVKTIENIEHDIEEYNKSLVAKKARQDINLLKKQK